METFALESPSADVRRFVPSRRELAAALGCHEKTVANMLLEPGNPGTVANGSYELEPWRAFFKSRTEEKDTFALGDDAREAKLEHRNALIRERKARAEKAELEAAKLRGELVDVADVEKTVTEFCGRLKGIHHRAATVDAVNALSVELELTRDQSAKLLLFMEKFHTDFCEKVANTGDCE